MYVDILSEVTSTNAASAGHYSAALRQMRRNDLTNNALSVVSWLRSLHRHIDLLQEKHAVKWVVVTEILYWKLPLCYRMWMNIRVSTESHNALRATGVPVCRLRWKQVSGGVCYFVLCCKSHHLPVLQLLGDDDT